MPLVQFNRNTQWINMLRKKITKGIFIQYKRIILRLRKNCMNIH